MRWTTRCPAWRSADSEARAPWCSSAGAGRGSGAPASRSCRRRSGPSGLPRRGRAAGATPGQRKRAADVGRAPPPAGSAVLSDSVRPGHSFLQAARRGARDGRTFASRIGRPLCPKMPAASRPRGADTAGQFGARRRRRVEVASATAPSSLSRGMPPRAVDHMRRWTAFGCFPTRPTTSRTSLTSLPLVPTAFQAVKPTRSSSGLDASLGCPTLSHLCPALDHEITF